MSSSLWPCGLQPSSSSVHEILQAKILEWIAFPLTGIGKYICVYGDGSDNPLQYSCLENPVERRPWWAIVHRVAKSQTWLSNSTFFHNIEEGLANYDQAVKPSPLSDFANKALLSIEQSHSHQLHIVHRCFHTTAELSSLNFPSIFPSIKVFSNESALHIRWPTVRYVSFSFSISPSSEFSGLISFKID